MLRAVSVEGPPPSIAAGDQTVSDFAISCQRILSEAKLYWPRNTAKALARITGKHPRTCYRWFAAKPRKPDAPDIIAIVAAMRAEYQQRGRIFEQLSLDLS